MGAWLMAVTAVFGFARELMKFMAAKSATKKEAQEKLSALKCAMKKGDMNAVQEIFKGFDVGGPDGGNSGVSN